MTAPPETSRVGELARNPERFRHWPDLTYRYGLSWDELWKMPRAARRLYELALPRLMAEDLADSIDATSFPNLDKSGQKKMIRQLNKALEAGRPKNVAPPPASPEEAQARAAGVGIGMTLVDADGNVVTPDA